MPLVIMDVFHEVLGGARNTYSTLYRYHYSADCNIALSATIFTRSSDGLDASMDAYVNNLLLGKKVLSPAVKWMPKQANDW